MLQNINIFLGAEGENKVNYYFIKDFMMIYSVEYMFSIGSSRIERLLALCKSADLTTSLTPYF